MAQVVVSSKGQVVLPKSVREKLSLDKGTVLEVEVDGDRVLLRRVRRRKSGWRGWRGILKGTNALADHLNEHAEEAEA